MGRAPCCDKVGLKKGPWTIEEDRILINFIQRHGHGNWRALPKQAGLLRCGKSCRLRWMNYLKPDIKRGNFTKEEEDTIIQLHETMGNKWSAIAARLPGRTDNEIKNIWHTYLKKRLPKYQLASTKTKRQRQQKVTSSTSESPVTEILMQSSANLANSSPAIVNDTSTTTMMSQNVSDSSISNNITPSSPQQSSSDGTSSVTYQTNEIDNSIQSYDSFPMIDETFWSQDLLNNELDTANTPLSFGDDWTFQFPKDNIATDPGVPLYGDNYNYNSNNIITNTSTEFWYDIFVKAGESTELLEF